MIFAEPTRKLIQSAALTTDHQRFHDGKADRTFTDHRTSVSTLSTHSELGARLAASAYTVSSPTPLHAATSEIGIRMDSATRSKMVWLILGKQWSLARAALLSAFLPLVLGRISRALLYGVESFDLRPSRAPFLILLVFAAIAGIGQRVEQADWIRCPPSMRITP